MDPGTERQLWVIRKVVAVLRAEGVAAWLFGGWGLDARIGRITREHGDVEFWVERVHAERSRSLLARAGAAPLETQPPELAMSVAGMLAMKEQFPHLRNGRPWRPKDIADLAILRTLASAESPGTPRQRPHQP